MVGLERPGPGFADDVTVFVVGAGDASVNPLGKVHFAMTVPQSPVPGGGALFTVRFAVAVLPVSIVPMKRLFVVLVSVPVAEGVTLTLMTHVPFAATVPFENVIVLVPAVAVSAGVPQPLVVAPFGLAIVRFAGRLSTKLYPLNGAPLGFVSVNLSVETPLSDAGFGVNDFAMVDAVGSMIAAMRAPTPKSAL